MQKPPIWDHLAGHLSWSIVHWLFQHGVMPLYTPLSGSWLNMAESLQRIVCGRALAGQHPTSQEELMTCRARPSPAGTPPPPASRGAANTRNGANAPDSAASVAPARSKRNLNQMQRDPLAFVTEKT